MFSLAVFIALHDFDLAIQCLIKIPQLAIRCGLSIFIACRCYIYVHSICLSQKTDTRTVKLFSEFSLWSPDPCIGI